MMSKEPSMTMQGTRAGGSSAASSRIAGSPQNDALLQLIQRINGMLDEESGLLAGGPPDDFDRIIARKNHLALEVGRFASHVGPFAPDAAARLKLQHTKARLADNASVLQRNIDAVGEILAMVADVLNRAHSDGTYTYEAVRRGVRK
jgi:hypothetical protein